MPVPVREDAVPRAELRLDARRLILAGIILCIAVGTVWHPVPVRSSPPPHRTHTIELPPCTIQEMTLSNGLRVVLVHSPQERLAHVSTVYAAGSARDPEGQEGVAHLLEHLMFTSTAQHPQGEFRRRLDLITTERNGFTYPWGTVYMTACLPSFLLPVLSLEAERMGGITPTSDQFERERDLILQERVFRTELSPEGSLVAEMLRDSYGNHPFGKDAFGADSTLAALALDDVHGFRNSILSAGGVGLIVHGPIPLEEMAESVLSCFSGQPALAPDTNRVEEPFPGVNPTETDIFRSDYDGLVVAHGYRLPARTARERALSYLTAEAYQLPTATVCNPLPEETFLCYLEGVLLIPGHETEAALYAQDEMDVQFQNQGWKVRTRIPMRKIKENTLRSLQARISGGRSSIDFLAPSMFSDSSLAWIETIPAVVDTISQRTLLAYVEENTRVALQGSLFGQGVRSSRTNPPAEVLRASADSTRPREEPLTTSEIAEVLDAYGTASLPEISTSFLSNGMPLHSIRIPWTTETWVGGVRPFPFLDEEKGGSKRGITRVYNMMVNRRYRSDSSLYVPLPYDLTIVAGPDCLYFWTRCVTTELFHLLWKLRERLDEDRFHPALVYYLSDLAPEVLHPDYVAPEVQATTFRLTAILGEGHPYLAWLGASENQDVKISEGNIKSLHREVTDTRNTRLVSVTNLTPETLHGMLDPVLGDRPKYREENDLPELVGRLQGVSGRVVQNSQREDTAIDVLFPPFPVRGPSGAGWATVSLVGKCIELEVLDRLRERDALCYWVDVRMEISGRSGMLEIGTSTRGETSLQALRSLRAELHALGTGNLDPDLFARAQLSLAGELSTQLEDPETAFSLILQMAEMGPPPGNPVHAILSVSLEEARATLERMMPVDRYAYSVCGPIREEDVPLFLE